MISLLRDFIGPELVELISPLPRAECVRRLQESTDRPGVWFGVHPVVGRVGGSSVRLRKRLRWNRPQTSLFATLEDEGRQTRVKCRIGIYPPHAIALLVITAVWTLGAGASVVMAIINALRSDLPMQGLKAALAPIGVLAFVLMIFTMASQWGWDERGVLLDFLRRTIDGRKV